MKVTATEMPFVLDASIAVCWAFDDEEHPTARLALERLHIDAAIAPRLWWFEVRNALLVSERRRRLTDSDSGRFLQQLARLNVAMDESPDETGVLALARRYQLSVYDAAYLELAARRALPLATLDRKLEAAAEAAGVALLRDL
jgi:predicted nucleic acid-binding protein